MNEIVDNKCENQFLRIGKTYLIYFKYLEIKLRCKLMNCHKNWLFVTFEDVEENQSAYIDLNSTFLIEVIK